MKRLFKCISMFVGWLQGGLYDFSFLPVSVFNHLEPKDMETLDKIHQNYLCKYVVLHVHMMYIANAHSCGNGSFACGP